MKKSEPKIILNMSIENEELENKIQIAMDKYVEDVVIKNLDEKIARLVENRIERLVKASRWDDYGKIAGVPLDDFVKQKTGGVIEEVIDKHIKEIFAKKVADMLTT